MLSVRSENGRVIIDLGKRTRDVLLNCSQAERLAYALEQYASEAERCPDPLFQCEVWNAKVESYDGLVALRFLPPSAGNVGRVPIPPIMARKLGDLVRFKAQQAAYKMRFEFA